MEFKSKYKTFHSRKCIWKYRLQNGGHFVQGGDELINMYRQPKKEKQHWPLSCNNILIYLTSYFEKQWNVIGTLQQQKKLWKMSSFAVSTVPADGLEYSTNCMKMISSQTCICKCCLQWVTRFVWVSKIINSIARTQASHNIEELLCCPNDAQ